MPEGERNNHLPPWAERERLRDLVWIGDNVPVFWPMAQAAYAEVGRGAIVADLTTKLENGDHPVAYCSHGVVVDLGDAEAIRMVEQYEPDWQFVTMLFKSEGRISTYRIGMYNQNADAHRPPKP